MFLNEGRRSYNFRYELIRGRKYSRTKCRKVHLVCVSPLVSEELQAAFGSAVGIYSLHSSYVDVSWITHSHSNGIMNDAEWTTFRFRLRLCVPSSRKADNLCSCKRGWFSPQLTTTQERSSVYLPTCSQFTLQYRLCSLKSKCYSKTLYTMYKHTRRGWYRPSRSAFVVSNFFNR